jgi:Tfp pilus assembly PilM family ATPase
MSAFIKDILLPEKIKNYYLFSKTVVGIEINKTHIIATKTKISGTTSSIELIVEEKISEEVSEEDFSRTSPALTAIFAKLGSYDEIHTVLPSSIVVFKELKFPFTTRDKISMIVGFEIEPLLPFSARDAIIDFIITREIPEEKSAEILVTAVQKQQVIQHVAMFEAIGIRPDVVTVDMVCVYGLYKHIPAYKQLQGGTVLINITAHATTIAFMVNGQLKTVRTLPKGVITLTKQIAQDLNKTPQEIVDHLIRFGFDANATDHFPSLEKTFSDWWESVNFTLNSFSAQLLNRQPVTKIIFLGTGSLIKDVVPFIEKKSGISCVLFDTEGIEQDASFTLKNSNLITPVNLVSASATLPLPEIVDYNLAQKEFTPADNSLLLKQLIVLVVLTISLFATVITHYYIQTNKLATELHASEQEALKALTSTFKNLEDAKELDEETIEDARKELKEQKDRWFAFSNQSRASFLQYLLELSKIDRKKIDLKVDQIIIGEGVLTLKAEVRDHSALKLFEHELSQSKLLNNIESPQETPEFTMRILLKPISEEVL